MLVGSRRSVRLIVASAFCAGAVALSACGTGQITQTANQVAPVPGVSVDIAVPGGGTVSLRNVTIAYGGPAGYAKGGSAPLDVRIFNDSSQPITLTGVDAGAIGRVLTGGSPETIGSASPSATSSASVTPSASPSGQPSGTASASPSAAATPTASPAPAGQQGISIRIPPGQYALLLPGQGAYLQLTGLTEDLKPGMIVPITFTFDNGVSRQLNVPVAIPLTPLPRATPDNEVSNPHAEEGEGEDGSE